MSVLLACLRFGALLHDWPEGYFKAQQSKGEGLAGVFRQAMDQSQAQKATKARSILARMFPGSAMAKLQQQGVSASALRAKTI